MIVWPLSLCRNSMRDGQTLMIPNNIVVLNNLWMVLYWAVGSFCSLVSKFSKMYNNSITNKYLVIPCIILSLKAEVMGFWMRHHLKGMYQRVFCVCLDLQFTDNLLTDSEFLLSCSHHRLSDMVCLRVRHWPLWMPDQIFESQACALDPMVEWDASAWLKAKLSFANRPRRRDWIRRQ